MERRDSGNGAGLAASKYLTGYQTDGSPAGFWK